MSLLQGCAVLRPADDPGPPPPVREADFHCARATMGRDSPYRMPLAGRVEDPAQAAQLATLPAESRRAALAAGLEPLLARILGERAAAGGEPTASAVAAEEELTLRLLAFEAQVSAAAYEAGCTATMIQRVLAELGDREQSRQVSIAVGSLIFGALAGVVGGIWGLADRNSNGPPTLAIVGGVATTALGTAALVRQQRAIPFEHTRNRLAPIWQGSDPDHLYPTFVFRMLTAAPTDGQAPRGALLVAWRRRLERALPPSRRELALQLLISDGGTYDESMLALRAELFQAVESAVQGIARDLELLNRSLVRTLATPGPVPHLPTGAM
jgi:hypothetical protein